MISYRSEWQTCKAWEERTLGQAFQESSHGAIGKWWTFLGFVIATTKWRWSLRILKCLALPEPPLSVQLNMTLPALDTGMEETYYLSHPERQGLLILMNLVLLHSCVLFSPEKTFINYLLTPHCTSGKSWEEEWKIETPEETIIRGLLGKISSHNRLYVS